MDGTGRVPIQSDAFAAECDDTSAEDASLDDPQLHAPCQSDLAQAESVPIIQIGIVHNDSYAARTIAQRHDGILPPRPEPFRIVDVTLMRNIHGFHT